MLENEDLTNLFLQVLGLHFLSHNPRAVMFLPPEPGSVSLFLSHNRLFVITTDIIVSYLFSQHNLPSMVKRNPKKLTETQISSWH